MMGSVEKKVPCLQYIEKTDVDKIIAALVQDGGVVIKNFTTPGKVDQVNADTNKPYLDADRPWNVSNHAK